MTAGLRMRGVRKRFGGIRALDGVDLELRPDAYTCVMGPSGSGKTTLLRAIAGLVPVDDGTILLGERRLDGLAPERRPVHSVFQTPALFPHLDVGGNVAFSARVGGERIGELAPRVQRALEQVGLDPVRFMNRDPMTLSGGERQRVALARALFDRPAYLLLDEPLAALDRPRRADLRRELARTQHREGLGFVHVTHEPEDALALADELVVLVDGRVRAQGDPLELYRRPPDLVTARLLGELTPVPHGSGWLRPERLRVVPRAEGMAAASFVGQVCGGGRWEIEVEVGPRRHLVFAADAWDLDVECGVVWQADDVIETTS